MSARTFLPVLASGTFLAIVGAVLASAGPTLGYDFLAYRNGAARVLAGLPLYDVSAGVAGPFGLYLYPPPFVLAVLPFAVGPELAAAWVWIGLEIAALLGAIALMPVARHVRWTMLLLAGLSWPVAYALKLGQVGPLLVLMFVVGWRWLDRPVALGISSALGTAVKLQPGIAIGWAVLRGRWRAAAIAVVTLIALSAVATDVVGIGAWQDYATLLRAVSDPVSTAHNFTPGAIAYQLGMSTATASFVQAVNLVLVIAIVLGCVAAASDEATYIALVPASQLLSPVLWDHYAIVLLVPVAWLLARGHIWAAAIPLVTSTLIVWLVPPIAYPATFWMALLGVGYEGLRDGRRAGATVAGVPSGS